MPSPMGVRAIFAQHGFQIDMDIHAMEPLSD